jgi:hypothetical protein
MIEFHIIYIFIIFILIYKICNKKNEKLNKNNIPTVEYYEWKRLFYKTMVLHEIKKIVKNKKWTTNNNNKSAYF